MKNGELSNVRFFVR